MCTKYYDIDRLRPICHSFHRNPVFIMTSDV